MARPALLLILPVVLAGCAGRRSDWPTLAPRAGEVSPMVPRNVPGLARCPQAADCAPPPAPPPPVASVMPPLPAPASAAEVDAELAAITAVLVQVETAAGPLRARRDAAARAAAGSDPESSAAAQAAQAESALQAALVPLSDAAFRLEALQARLADTPQGPALAARLRDLSLRIAALAP